MFVGSLLRIQLSDLSGYPFIFGAQFWQETSWVEPKYKKSVTWSSLTVTRKYVNGVCAIFSNTVDARFVGGSVAVVGQACLWATPALSIKLKTKTQIPHFLCFLCASIYRLVNIMPVQSTASEVFYQLRKRPWLFHRVLEAPNRHIRFCHWGINVVV